MQNHSEPNVQPSVQAAGPTDGADGGASASAAAPAQSPLEQKVTELEAQVKDKENRYLYLYAEFENYKRRAIKERSDAQKFGWENAARELLTVVDNLERAIEHFPKDADRNLAEGLKMVVSQFQTALEKQGVAVIPTVGQAFDPNLHEAVGQEASDQPTGNIVKEHQKGYTLHGRLLRPARVVISSGPAS